MLESAMYLLVSLVFTGLFHQYHSENEKIKEKEEIGRKFEFKKHDIKKELSEYKEDIKEYENKIKTYMFSMQPKVFNKIKQEVDKKYRPISIFYSLERLDDVKHKLYKTYPISFSKRSAKEKLLRMYESLNLINNYLDLQEKKKVNFNSVSNFEVCKFSKHRLSSRLEFHRKSTKQEDVLNLVKIISEKMVERFKNLKQKEILINRANKYRIILESLEEVSKESNKKKKQKKECPFM